MAAKAMVCLCHSMPPGLQLGLHMSYWGGGREKLISQAELLYSNSNRCLRDKKSQDAGKVKEAEANPHTDASTRSLLTTVNKYSLRNHHQLLTTVSKKTKASIPTVFAATDWILD